VKWVFLLSLLLVGAVAAVMGGLVAYRWSTSMQNDVKLVPGQLTMGQPAGTVPRDGGAELVVAREVYATRKNPVPADPGSLARGQKLYDIYCTPCHGASGKGDGLVTPRFIPPPDLTSAPVQAKTDGHFSYYIGYGGAVMPAYGEALSVTERWDLVNYLRTLAKKG
jgi:S-disulfanyl-L-cysteine oxidoreductase SoxD